MRFEKISKILIIASVFLTMLSSVVFAQQATPDVDDGGINFSGAVIDDRCIREKFADPDGYYAKFCSQDDNKEQYIICLNRAFPEDGGFFGIFNLFKSRLRLTPETLPALLRTVLLTFFAVVGVTTFWMSVWGYYRWISALNESPDEAAKTWKLFTNGVFGLIFSLAAVVLTWGLFYALGIRQEGDDFFQVGNEISNLLSMPCEDLAKDPSGKACTQFDYSCRQTTRSEETVDGRAQCLNVSADNKVAAVIDMPANVGVKDETGKLIYNGTDPCYKYKRGN